MLLTIEHLLTHILKHAVTYPQSHEEVIYRVTAPTLANQLVTLANSQRPGKCVVAFDIDETIIITLSNQQLGQLIQEFVDHCNPTADYTPDLEEIHTTIDNFVSAKALGSAHNGTDRALFETEHFDTVLAAILKDACTNLFQPDSGPANCQLDGQEIYLITNGSTPSEHMADLLGVDPDRVHVLPISEQNRTEFNAISQALVTIHNINVSPYVQLSPQLREQLLKTGRELRQIAYPKISKTGRCQQLVDAALKECRTGDRLLFIFVDNDPIHQKEAKCMRGPIDVQTYATLAQAAQMQSDSAAMLADAATQTSVAGLLSKNRQKRPRAEEGTAETSKKPKQESSSTSHPADTPTSSTV